jgi:hypothetical protein
MYALICLITNIIYMYFIIEFGDCYYYYCSVRQHDQQQDRTNTDNLIPRVRTENVRSKR